MRLFVLLLGLCLMLISSWSAFMWGAVEPAERNIIYVHVPSAICSLVCFGSLFVCSIGYLRTSSDRWDHAARACAEAGLIFATVMNVTGMIFARAEWGVWWTVSPRLVSSAVMWFLYVGYLILRGALAGERREGTICAVFGIIAFIDVPIVIISSRFIRDIHRPSFSFETSRQYAALGLSVLGALVLASALIWMRSEILKVQTQINGIFNRRDY